MNETCFADALCAATCDAEREALIGAVLAERAGADLVEFAQNVKSNHFDRYLNADLDRACAIADGIEQLGYAAHEVAIIALGLLSRGDAARQGGHALTAMGLHERAGACFLRAGDRVGWARSRGGWLAAATHAGRVTADALAEIDAARQVLFDAGQLFRLAVFEQNIGVAYQSLGHLQASQEAFERGLACLQPEHSLLRAMLLANQGNVFLWQGKLAAAFHLKHEAHAIFTAAHSVGAAAIEEMYLATLESMRWHMRDALHLMDAAISGLHQAKMPLSIALALIQRADVLMLLNRFDDALTDTAQAIALLRTLQAPIGLVYAFRVQAQALIRSGNEQEALLALQQSEDIARAAGYPQDAIAITLERIAVLLAQHHALEAREAALHLLRSPLVRETDNHRGMALLLATEATLELGKIAWAQAMARAVIKRAEELQAPELAYRGYLVLARAAYRQDHLHEAGAYYDRAIRYVQSLVSELVLDQRAQFLEDKDALYFEALATAMRAGDAARALAYLEQGRPRSDRVLATTQGAEQIQTELADLRRRHRFISASLLALRADSPAAQGAHIELKRLTRQIRDLLERQARRTDAAERGADDPRVAIQHVPMTTLAFALLERDLVIFVIRHGEVTAERVPDGVRQVRRAERTLRLAIDTLADRLTSAPSASLPAEVAQWDAPLRMALAKLWDLLIRPVAHLLPPSDAPLAIIPHGALHALPLAALFDGQHFLAERWLLHFVPSCQAFIAPASTAGPLKPLLALGYAQDDDLLFTPADARHVAEIMGGVAWTDAEATSERLAHEATGCAYLHIAAHGALRLDVPNASFVQLADGPFHPTDVLELDLRGCRLVTLSACETGLGHQSGGDEQIGLVRAFGFAGAEAVLATLWRVDDASTFAFMDHVYRHLAAGAAPSEAVRAAQLAFIHAPDPAFRAHPYFWAAFQLTMHRVQQTRHAEGGTANLHHNAEPAVPEDASHEYRRS
jgi:CHAT domain-containing protein/tetratricopeptide (TPR) repeat protein